MALPIIDLLSILPQIIIVLAALLVLLADVLVRDAARRVLPALTLLALLAAIAASLWLAADLANPRMFQEMASADGFALGFGLIILITALLAILLAKDSLSAFGGEHVGTFYALVLLSVAGMMFMGAALDLLVVFLALEILSLALYILVGFNLTEPRSAEASLKYFLLGAFASAFFLYGAALVYAAAGTTNLNRIAAALVAGEGQKMILLYAGTALLIVGFGFKVALVPFHMWAPDAYQGAPTPVTAFMSVGAKAAGFAAFLRVFVIALPVSHEFWSWALAILAVITMTLGNLAALRQLSLKRMLAYSGIAHAGYLLVALAPGTSQGAGAALFYLFGYLFMNVGAFAVVVALERPGDNDVEQAQFAGLAQRRPVLAAAMAIFMFSLAGVPPLAGFFAKLAVFSAAMAEGWGWLVVIGVINSVISAFYYLRVTVEMYFVSPVKAKAEVKAKASGKAEAYGAKPVEEATVELEKSSRSVSAAILLATAGTVGIAILLFPLTDWISRAINGALGG